MKEQVIDASVALEWFLPEEDSPAAQVLMDDSINEVLRLVIPEVLFLEVANGLRLKEGLNKNLVDKALQGLWGLNLSVVALDDKLLKSAGRLAFETESTVYEALYLALAHERGCELVTADQRFLEKARQAGYEEVRGLWE